MQVVVGGDLRNCAERGLSSLPQQHAFLIRRSLAYVGCTVFAADVRDSLRVDIDPVGKPVDLGEKNGAGISGVSHVDVILHCDRDALIHHFHCGRHDSGGDDSTYRCGCITRSVE